MKLLCCLLALFGSALASAPSAQTDCPNQKAKHVPANDVSNGLFHCDLHIHLFGVEIVIDGPDCYQTIYHYPDHNYCDGSSNPGTQCVEGPSLFASVEHCQCGVSLFGVHVMLPLCTCHDGGETVPCPNARTEPCLVAAGTGRS